MCTNDQILNLVSLIPDNTEGYFQVDGVYSEYIDPSTIAPGIHTVELLYSGLANNTHQSCMLRSVSFVEVENCNPECIDLDIFTEVDCNNGNQSYSVILTLLGDGAGQYLVNFDNGIVQMVDGESVSIFGPFDSGTSYDITITSASNPDCVTTLVEPIHECTVTPLTLLSFTASIKGSKNLIEWETANEVNTDYFSVMRSENGIDFYSIATLDAKGQSSSFESYFYEDNEVENRSYFYRLDSYDVDNSHAFSQVIYLERFTGHLAEDFLIAPNPVGNWMQLTMIGSSVTTHTIRIIDLAGRIIKEYNMLPDNAQNIILDVNYLNSGIYFIQYGDINQQIKTQRFIKI